MEKQRIIFKLLFSKETEKPIDVYLLEYTGYDSQIFLYNFNKALKNNEIYDRESFVDFLNENIKNTYSLISVDKNYVETTI